MNIGTVKIVLVNTSHPGNIGATARAMKTMGLSELILVSPHLFPHREATFLAAGADDILERATVAHSLREAIRDCQWVIGVSVRQRKLERPIDEPRICAEKISLYSGCVAVVFGRENNGLSNEELSLCHTQICIPSHPDFGSLNIAAAVQIICYEIRMAMLAKTQGTILKVKKRTTLPLANADQVAGFYAHLRDTLIALKAFNPKQPRRLMQRLQLLFNRAQLTVTELNILRGILKAVNRKIKKE